jgi:uncharacterized membrane protein (UPF0127 family)
MPDSRLSMDLPPKPRSSVLGPFLAIYLLVACGSSEGQSAEDTVARQPPPEGTQSTQQERLPPSGEAWVIFGSDTVEVELARTPAEREAGLMYREDLLEGRGMLFIFPDAQIRSFWMRNTFIPLDIAYIDENLRIIDIQAMEPETEDAHPSSRPAMFALEVPLGWFAKMGIEAGAQARLVFGPG